MIKLFLKNLFKVNFTKRHGKIVETFQLALDEATKLSVEMMDSIKEKENKLTEINNEIEEIKTIKLKTVNFINNISKLIEG